MSDILGSSPDPNMPLLGDFSFINTAETLASDLIQSVVSNLWIALDFEFIMDLNPIFDEFAASRIPNSFIRINHFDMWGEVGVNDWNTQIDFSGVKFTVSEAMALVNVSAALSSSSPIIIDSPSDFEALVNPPTENSDKIVFDAGLQIDFPVFLTFEGVGVGSRIGYM